MMIMGIISLINDYDGDQYNINYDADDNMHINDDDDNVYINDDDDNVYINDDDNHQKAAPASNSPTPRSLRNSLSSNIAISLYNHFFSANS